MSPAFKPKGEKPEWRLIYEDLLDGADFGDIISYTELDALLGRRFLHNRSPIYRARREFGDVRKRWLEAVPNLGYRVIAAGEHMRLVRQHKRKGLRQIGLAKHVGDVTDIGRLSATELVDYDVAMRQIYVLHYVVVQHEQRLNRIEEILRADGKLPPADQSPPPPVAPMA